MKKIIKKLFALLIIFSLLAAILYAGRISAFLTGETDEFNIFTDAGLITDEFIANTIEIISKNYTIENSSNEKNITASSHEQNCENEPHEANEAQDSYLLKQIVLYVKNGETFKNTYDAENYTTNGEGLYFLQYKTQEAVKTAYAAYSNDPDITYVTLNKPVYTAALTDRWGAERTNTDMFSKHLDDNGKTNEQLIVAVLDTGAEVSHQFLKGRIVSGYNSINNNSNVTDGHGHGTHVSGTVVDNTPPNVKIMPVKVLTDKGEGSDLTVSLGIKYAADNNAKVINMSLGGECNDKNCLIKSALDYSESKNVTTVAAAGNESSDTKDYCPAKYENVITVAATDKDDLSGTFSNYGDAVDISAPGVRILSAYTQDRYAYMSGTSMAAPHIAAAAAMFRLSDPAYTPQHIKEQIKSSAVDLGEPGWDKLYGAGVLDFRIFFDIKIPVTSINFTKNQLNISNIELLGSVDLYAFVLPFDATDKSIHYENNNESLFEYKNRKIHPRKEGSARLTATASNKSSAVCEINITNLNNWIYHSTAFYDGGSGTENDPYQIATPYQMAKLLYDVRVDGKLFENEYFILKSDIDLQGYEWNPILYTNKIKNEDSDLYSDQDKRLFGFRGTFDGNGYSVKNMKIINNSKNNDGETAFGLFGYVGVGINSYSSKNKKAEIKNLAVLDADISGKEYFESSGIICGITSNSIITSCYTAGKTSGAALAGGLSGKVTVKNCYSIADAEYALIYNCDDSNISNSYFAGKSDYYGFIVSVSIPPNVNTTTNIFNTQITNCFGAAEVLPDRAGFILQADTKLAKNSYITTQKCYYTSGYTAVGNLKGNNITLDISKKESEFFKDYLNYSNASNWSSSSLWDFESTWAIDENINNGFPFLKIFEKEEAMTTTETITATTHETTAETTSTSESTLNTTTTAETSNTESSVVIITTIIPFTSVFSTSSPVTTGLQTTAATNGTNLTTEIIKIIKGDINGDNNVNGMDLLLMKQHILSVPGKEIEKGTPAFDAADMNGDGAINGIDLLLLKKKILS